MRSLSSEMLKVAREQLRAGAALIRTRSGDAAGGLVLRQTEATPDGGLADYEVPAIYEERCVLIVDLVGWSLRSMEERFALVETMNGLLLSADEEMRNSHAGVRSRATTKAHVWDIYKGMGDGAIFVFGTLLDPISVRDALAFAAYAMAQIYQHKRQLPADALNGLNVRMALARGRVFVTQDLDGHDDILGDAINLCARLVSSKRAQAGSILVEESIFHNLMINTQLYFRNEDNSQPAAGSLSDFVLGRKPHPEHFLYLQYDGEHETKDRVLRAYNLAGRINGTDILR